MSRWMLLSWLVEALIFQPTRGVDVRPEQLGIIAEEVWLHTEDEVRLHAFFLPAPNAERVVLFLHGNAGNASHRLPNAAELTRLGTHVLLLDYRGYGKSDGSPTEEGVYLDARAALDHLTNARGYALEQIFVFGRSIGAAIAIDLAQERELAGIVLEGAFPSIEEVASHVFGAPFAWLAGRRFDSSSKISRVESPLLFFHGDQDEVIDFTLGRQLYALAPEPKAFETIVGAGHNNTVSVGGRPYFARIQLFLDQRR